MGKQIRYAEIVQEHVIKAPRERVYRALTEEVNAWWCHAINENPTLRLEARLGGKFYEECANGGGMLFGTVTWLKPGEELELTGGMGWDGPAQGTYSFTLVEKGQETLLKLEHKFFGPLNDETEANYVEGWKEVIGLGFKNYVEKGTRIR